MKTWMGVLIGGMLPALVYGLGGVLQKTCQQAGIGFGAYPLFLGLGVLCTGAVIFGVSEAKEFNPLSAGIAFVIGMTWVAGMACVGLAIRKYGVPISKLAPLYNMNTLIAVLLGLLFYMEWREVNALQLIIGAVLIVVGGALVANA